MIGTGFIKCIPITLSFLLVAFASLVIDIEDVLDAIIVFSGHLASNSLKIDSLISIFSETASITKSEFIT